MWSTICVAFYLVLTIICYFLNVLLLSLIALMHCTSLKVAYTVYTLLISYCMTKVKVSNVYHNHNIMLCTYDCNYSIWTILTWHLAFKKESHWILYCFVLYICIFYTKCVWYVPYIIEGSIITKSCKSILAAALTVYDYTHLHFLLVYE